MSVVTYTLFRLAIVLAVVVMAAVAAILPVHAQQVDDSLPALADLTITSEYVDRTPLAWAVTVKNNTVGAHPGMHVHRVKVRITVSDPVRGDTTSLLTIRDLPPGGSAEELVETLRNVPAADDEPEWAPQRLYAEIIESDPVESPRFQFNNATENWAVENRQGGHGANGRTYAADGDIALDVAGVSDRFPRQAGATTFTVSALNYPRYTLDLFGINDQSHLLFEVQVEISLSPGLSFAANQSGAPAGTTFDASTGIWNMGTVHSSQRSQLLPVAVNLTADSLADLPLEDRCLTAKVVNAVPWFANDPSKRVNDTATACLGTALFSSGTMDLVSFYPCISDTSPPAPARTRWNWWRSVASAITSNSYSPNRSSSMSLTPMGAARKAGAESGPQLT